MREELDVRLRRLCNVARWSVIGWVTKNLLSRATPFFRRHVKMLDPAQGPRGGLWPVLLMCDP
jgi:hypothetical protein